MDRLPTRVIAAYALPAIPMAALYFPVFVFLAPVWAEAGGLPLAALGAVFVAVRLLDAVSDPAVGWLSDRTPGRFGRRRPWIAASVPLVALAVWQLFHPDPALGIWGFAGWLAVLTLSWTMFLTPYFAWGAELSPDYAERGRVTIWRETVTLTGTILAAILFSLGGEGVGGLGFIAAFVVLTLPVAVGLAVGVAPEARARRPAPGAETLIATWRAEPAFRRLVIAYLVNGAANGVPATLFLFFVTHRLAAEGWGGPLLILYFGAGVLAAPLWLWAARRFEKHRIWCVSMIYAAAVFSVVPFLGPGDVWAFAVICVLTGAAVGSDLALPAAMQADVVDLDTARGGAPRTGAFFALWSVATKAALALAGGAALIAADLIGFRPEGGSSEAALTGLGALYALSPVALKLAAVAIMWSFPLDRAAQARVRAEIAEQS
ncbi:MAG: MFS transporter [Pseudomonadota bacterium]